MTLRITTLRYAGYVQMDDVTKEATKKKLKQCFDVFDHKSEGRADVREIGTIVRSLQLAPSEKRLSELLVQMEDEEQPTSVRYDRFEKVMLRVLEEDDPDMKRDDEEVLLNAFRAFDEEGTGSIKIADFREAMTTQGEAFSNEMIDQMLTAMGVQQQSDAVDYRKYLELVTQD